MQQSPQVPPQRADEPLPEAREVASGVWKITLPIPFPLRTVNVYALIGNDSWALVDAGIGVPEARAAFWEGLQRIGLPVDTLRAIVLSHDHPDHIGLSGELQEQSSAAVYMHPIDEASMHFLWGGKLPDSFLRVSKFFLQHGMPPGDRWFSLAGSKQVLPIEPADPQGRSGSSVAGSHFKVSDIIRVPRHEAITLVEDGEEIDLVGERYRVIWTPGHSDGHICLFRERDGMFLAADHVLPRITPNVGLYSEYDRANPLGDYLHSLEKVAKLPASIVLPGHGEPFTDLAGRTAEITQHHIEREMQIMTLLDDRPQHAYSVAQQIFANRWKNNEARRMALAETLSHLEYLRFNGQVEQQHTTDGLILYAAV